MRQVVIPFMPLSPGESPGDPELGGWRPLRSWFPTILSTPVEALPLSLEEAVQIVAARIARFQLRQAIEIVAQRLAKYQQALSSNY